MIQTLVVPVQPLSRGESALQSASHDVQALFEPYTSRRHCSSSAPQLAQRAKRHPSQKIGHSSGSAGSGEEEGVASGSDADVVAIVVVGADAVPEIHAAVAALRKRPASGILFLFGSYGHRPAFESTLLKIPGRSSFSTRWRDQAVPAGLLAAGLTMKSLIPCGVFATSSPLRYLSGPVWARRM